MAWILKTDEQSVIVMKARHVHRAYPSAAYDHVLRVMTLDLPSWLNFGREFAPRHFNFCCDYQRFGQAMQPVGVLFSGVAFIVIAITLFQRADLGNQREELRITRDEQQRSSEIALRQLHNDIVKMAIQDPELRSVWPQLLPGIEETKKGPLL